MTGLELLQLSRRAAEDLRRQEETCLMLRELLKNVGGNFDRITVEERIVGADETLERMQRERECAMAAATRVIDKLNGQEKEVCWQYYILGNTIKQISVMTHCRYRTVQKIKASALEHLKGE